MHCKEKRSTDCTSTMISSSDSCSRYWMHTVDYLVLFVRVRHYPGHWLCWMYIFGQYDREINHFVRLCSLSMKARVYSQCIRFKLTLIIHIYIQYSIYMYFSKNSIGLFMYKIPFGKSKQTLSPDISDWHMYTDRYIFMIYTLEVNYHFKHGGSFRKMIKNSY